MIEDFHRKKFYKPYKGLTRRDYLTEKSRLQSELLKLQYWAIENKKRIAISFDGRDAAGKGGTIKRFVENLMPKHLRVVELHTPSKRESRGWFRRYSEHFPDEGELVFFDRSWYNRALIEPTMGYCSKNQYKYFIKKVLNWEEDLIARGMILIKFYLSVDQETQLFRFNERIRHPLKYWKLSENDKKAREKWHFFTKFKEQMFQRTSSQTSPWIVINANDKYYTRLSAMLYVINSIPYVENQNFRPMYHKTIEKYKTVSVNGVEVNNLNDDQFTTIQHLSSLALR